LLILAYLLPWEWRPAAADAAGRHVAAQIPTHTKNLLIE
jgi:hypothetical protein